MTDDPAAGEDDAALNDQETAPSGPPAKRGFSFYAALALIGLLVLMLVFLNEPAAWANAGRVITQANWTLQSSTDTTGIHIPIISGSRVTVRFDKDGTLTGSAGCNRYTAAYQTREYSINISGTSSTKMFCHGPGVMELESAFLAVLPKVSFFRVSKSSLKFYEAFGKTVLVFVSA
jgi:heat shock protein HslJ